MKFTYCAPLLGWRTSTLIMVYNCKYALKSIIRSICQQAGVPNRMRSENLTYLSTKLSQIVWKARIFWQLEIWLWYQPDMKRTYSLDWKRNEIMYLATKKQIINSSSCTCWADTIMKSYLYLSRGRKKGNKIMYSNYSSFAMENSVKWITHKFSVRIGPDQ